MNALVKNIFALFVLRGANYILPLITVPYLVRVLGPTNFGRIAFALAFVQYFVVMTDFGFNLSATRAIASAQADAERLSNIFSAVMIIKTVLMTVGFGAMLLTIGLVPGFDRDWSLFLLVYLAVVGNVLFPVWLFQGLQRMRHIAILTILSRIVVVLAIFIFVQQPSDYRLAAALQASSFVIAGLSALYTMPRVVHLRLCWPGIMQLRNVTVDGWHVFLSTAAINLYTSSNIFFLGLFANSAAVGYFAAAQKLVNAVVGAVTPISQAVYPHVASLTTRSPEKALAFIAKLFRLQGGITLVLSVGMFALAEPLVHLLLGEDFQSSVRLVEWMAALPLIIGISNVLGVQTMLNFGMEKAFSHILLFAGFVNIVSIVPLAKSFGAQGAAAASVLTEIVVTVLMVLVLARKRLIHQITSISGVS